MIRHLVLLSTIAFCTRSFATLRYKIETIPLPEPSHFDAVQYLPTQINDLGQVLVNVAGFYPDGKGAYRPFIYDRTKNVVLWTNPAYNEGYAARLNNVGDAITYQYYDSQHAEYVLHKNNAPIRIINEADAVFPMSIADDGTWCGNFYRQNSNGEESVHAATYRDGQRSELLTFGGQFSSASAMNSSKCIVGVASDEQGVQWGCIWENGSIRKLEHAGSEWLAPTSISNSSWITGRTLLSNGTVGAFSMNGGTFWEYSMRGDQFYVHAISDDGTAVASLSNYGNLDHAVVLQQGQSNFLWDISDAGTQGWTNLLNALDINSTGTICGIGLKGGMRRGFMATPVPEAATWLALGVGLLGVRKRNQK